MIHSYLYRRGSIIIVIVIIIILLPFLLLRLGIHGMTGLVRKQSMCLGSLGRRVRRRGIQTRVMSRPSGRGRGQVLPRVYIKPLLRLSQPRGEIRAKSRYKRGSRRKGEGGGGRRNYSRRNQGRGKRGWLGRSRRIRRGVGRRKRERRMKRRRGWKG